LLLSNRLPNCSLPPKTSVEVAGVQSTTAVTRPRVELGDLKLFHSGRSLHCVRSLGSSGFGHASAEGPAGSSVRSNEVVTLCLKELSFGRVGGQVDRTVVGGDRLIGLTGASEKVGMCGVERLVRTERSVVDKFELE